MLVATGGLAAWCPSWAQEPSRSQILRGSASFPAPATILRAGPVTLEFEPELAFVRYIRIGGSEILRGIYSAVRDSTWLTVLPRVTNIVAEIRERSFKLTFAADCTQGPIGFLWRGTITGDEAGTIRFEMDGTAKTAFQRNRIGFCVLHPLTECVGKSYSAELANGTGAKGVFPEKISPHQPVKDLKSISHMVAPGLEAEVRFEGDLFEMEDHRNWTDGNFKTYCTPLALPYPVAVAQGARIRQAIVVQLKGTPPPFVATKPVEVRLEAAGKATGKLPPIGTCWSAMDTTQAAKLKSAGVKHLRVDLRPGEDRGAILGKAARDAAAIGASLDIAAFVTIDAEKELAALAARKLPRDTRYLVFHASEKVTNAKWTAMARKLLNGAKIGGGTDEYFTELNRERPPMDSADFIAYSLNPQVHAFDDRSLVENLAPQGDTVRSAKAFLGNTPVAVSPITLRPRFNPQAKTRDYNDPKRFDYRHASLFAAAWTLASVKYLAESGASSLTYYEAAGPGGWLGANGPNPLFHVLSALAPLAGADVIPVSSSDPLRSAAILLRTGSKVRLIVANLTLEPQMIRVAGVPMAASKQIFTLDEHSPGNLRGPETIASKGDISLAVLPYGVKILDGTFVA